MTTKVSYDDTQRALLKRLLQLYVGHGTSVEGFALVDVSTNLSLSRAETEALVETLVSEGYLYSTIDDEHHQITCDEMPSDEELSSLAASQGRQWSAPSATAPSTASRPPPAPPLRRLQATHRKSETVMGTTNCRRDQSLRCLPQSL